MKLLLIFFPLIAAFGACGKYPEYHDETGVGHAGIADAATGAEKTGENYVPQFLAAGYKTLDVQFEIKETLVDLGGGFKYRALTYDGAFPAKTIVVEQGTLVRIKIVNTDSAPHGIHTHVIKYTPANDGVAVSETPAGGTRYYFWEVTDSTPTGFYPFHDHGGDNEGAQARGLIGMVNVVRNGETANPGFGLLLHDIDPRYLYSTSGKTVGTVSGGHGGVHGNSTEAPSAIPAHLVNGKFGADTKNTFEIVKSQDIRLGVVNLGSQIHTFHSHGNSWTDASGVMSDNLELMPGSFRTIQLKGDAVGTWLYHCHVAGHPEGGMWGKYIVK